MAERTGKGEPKAPPLDDLGARACRRCMRINTKQMRSTHKGLKTFRPRLCLDCGARFVTVEELGVWQGWVRESQT